MGRRSRWDRYTAAAISGAGSKEGSRDDGLPAGSPLSSQDGIPAILQRIATYVSRPRTEGRRERRSSARSVSSDAADTARPHTELRLVPVAGCAWASAAAAVRLPGQVTLLAAAAGAVLLLLLLLTSRRSRKPRFRGQAAAALAPLAVLILVASSAGSAVVSRSAGPAGVAVASGASITGQFTAISDARAAAADRFSGGPRYLLEAELRSFTLAGERFPANLPVLVVGGEAYADINLGDAFTTAGVLSASGAGDRTAAVLRSSRTPAVDPADGLLSLATDLRTGFAGRAQTLGPTDAAGLLPGMVLGDRSTASTELTTAMQNTGLTHLTAVSGANCSYLLAFVFLLFRAVRLPRGAAATVAVLVLAGFVLVVRPDASVLRAAVMGSIGTAAVLTGRGKVPAALLCLCATVLLVLDPWLSGSYAFILSVCATAGLIFLGPRLTAGLDRFLPHPVAVLTAVPLAAQVACSPVLVLLQPNLPAYSLPANIAAAPVVPFVTIAGMAAVLLGYLAPPLDFPLLISAGVGSGWVAGVARFFAQAPGALLPWLPGPAGAAAMAGAAALLAFCIVQLGRAKSGSDLSPSPPVSSGRGSQGLTPPGGRQAHPARGIRRSGMSRPQIGRVAAICLATALTITLGAVALRLLLRANPVHAEWIAAACDVGQGDALAVRTGPEAAILIDAGPDPPALDACLDRLGIRTIDMLVITHVHEDHYVGASAAAEGREVKSLAFSSAEPGLPAEIRELGDGLGVRPERLNRGGQGVVGTVRWNVLWPPAGSGGGASATGVPRSGSGTGAPDGHGSSGPADTMPGLSENDASAVLMIRSAGVSFLFTGDLEEDAARQMLRMTPELRAQPVHVLKVAHHGARNSGQALPEELRPLLAVISVGEGNTYGHPAPETLRNLESGGAQVARTDQLGSFILHIEEGKLMVSALGRGP